MQHVDDEEEEEEDDEADDDDDSDTTNDDELDTDMIDDRDSPDDVSANLVFIGLVCETFMKICQVLQVI